MWRCRCGDVKMWMFGDVEMCMCGIVEMWMGRCADV